jgi:PIG-P
MSPSLGPGGGLESSSLIMPVATSTGDGNSEPRPSHARANSNDEPTSPASPLARFPPLPPAESRSRAPEFYGFVAWAVTYLLFVLYFLWPILPDEWIIWLGVTWYPNRCVHPTRRSPSFGTLPGPLLFKF